MPNSSIEIVHHPLTRFQCLRVLLCLEKRLCQCALSELALESCVAARMRCYNH